MYKHLVLLAILAMGLNACGPVYVVQQPAPAPAPDSPPPANPDDVSYQTFYDQLSPYGQWIEDPDYGFVWMPDVTPDFKPYATNGHWVYTDEGWAWDSDYAWGWAAFHYGRWFFRDGYGWMWVPGNDWAPAWVSWRNSDDYYGWAPMEPGISVNVAYSSGYNPPPHYWCFVPHQYVASPQINNYYVRESNNVTIINRTTVINNTTIINHYGNNRYGAGPDPREVGRFSGTQPRPMPVRESRAPGGDRAAGGGFTVYRPHVNSTPPAADRHVGNNGRPGYAPANSRPLSGARPVNRTSYGANPTPPPGRTSNAQPANGEPTNRQPVNAQPTNGQPANGQPANNPPTYSRPPAGQPSMNPGQQGQPNNNNRPSRSAQPSEQPSRQPSARPAGRPSAQPAGQPSVQPAGRPSVQQPAPAIRQQQPQRPFRPAPAQNAGGHRPANGQPTQNSNHPRPIGNRPRPTPPQRNPPPPQKKDDGRTANKP